MSCMHFQFIYFSLSAQPSSIKFGYGLFLRGVVSLADKLEVLKVVNIEECCEVGITQR